MAAIKLKPFLLFILPLLLSGCWDAEEVTNRIIVLALGMDTANNGRVKISAQVPIVEELLPVSGGDQVSPKPFFLLTSEGKSAFAAVPGLQNKTQRSLFYGQIKAVVIGKALAEQGLKGPTDSLTRHPQIPPQSYVLLTKGKAEEILSKTLSNKRIPAYAPVTFFQAHGKQDQAFSQQIWELLRNINSKTQDGFLPIIEFNAKEKTFVIKGLGIFHKDRLVGELTGEETRMFGFLTGRARNSYISLPVANHGRITFRRMVSKPRIKAILTGQAVLFKIQVKVSGYMIESTQGETELSRDDIITIQKATGQYLHREMTKTIKKLQALNSDILALGEEYRATDPDQWKRTDWSKVYPAAKFQLSVKFAIQRSGTVR